MASAARIYGDEMDMLWGKMYPVPAGQLTALDDNDTISIGDMIVQALDTPGHAYHHMSYVIGDMAFTGDVGGATVPGYQLVDAAMPPPEFNLEAWQNSIDRLMALDLKRIYLTHFGEVQAVKRHLSDLKTLLTEAAEFVRVRMQAGKTQEEITHDYQQWYHESFLARELPDDVFKTLAMSNQPSMTTGGVMRYWRKRWESEQTTA
jgi:glyoxylase-like metal-dependent hydrolase (beta-lactamase superfamily II)